MSVSLLHISNLRLDALFPAFGPARRADLRAALGRILALARERQVDAVTIAGDLYEQNYALPDTAAFLSQQFARLAPIHVFIAPGERDPYTNDSLYALTRWPENVTIFSQGQLVAVELAPGVNLWGAACPPARGHQTLDDFHITSEGTNLLLLHAGDTDKPVSRTKGTFTVSTNSVRAAGFDFALLGHVHAAQLWPKDDPLCLYPGSPEPLGPEAEDSQHTVALVTVDKNGCAVESIEVNQWRQRAVQVDVTRCDSVSAAAQRVQQALGELDAQLICEVTLVGLPDIPLDAAAVLDEVDTPAHLSGQAHFAFPYNLERLAQEQTVRGLLVRRFQSDLKHAKDEAERQRRLRALALALQALDGKQVQPYEIA
jgi:DNA repair protein SbcD/Mre11